MVNKNIVNYIAVQFQKGYDREEIKNALMTAGWKVNDIEEAFHYAGQGVQFAPAYTGSFGDAGMSSLPGAGFLLGEAWGIYLPRIKTFAGIIIIQILAMAAIFIGMVVLLYISTSGIFASSALALMDGSGGIMPLPSRSGSSYFFSNLLNWLTGFAIVFFAVVAPIIIAQVWGQAAMIYAIKDSEENIGAIEAYRRSWRKIGSFFWVGFLASIIIFGGFMFFAIPGIIFAVWFSLAGYIVITEGAGGMDALLKSREYMRGRAWEVFGLLLVMFLIWIGVWAGMQIGLGILNIIFSALGAGIIGVILSLLMGVVSAMFTPFMMTYSYLIYRHLRQIKGDVAVHVSVGKKLAFVAIGVLGILFGLGLFVFPFLSLVLYGGHY